MQVDDGIHGVSHNSDRKVLEQFTLEALSNKISNTLSVINTGKKITKSIVQNILFLWDEERTDFSTPHAKEVVRFRKTFLFKVNNRAKMLEMPVFKLWEDAIEVMTCDIDNPFLGDIRDTSKLSVFPEGIYKGELQDGKPHGKGIMVFREEWSFYKGMWKNGLYHGIGTMILKCNKKRDIYEGEWKNGLKHGNGKLIHIDNLDPYGYNYDNCYIYDGDWKEGTKHGMGKIIGYSHITNSHINPIDRVYEGEWKNDFYHGKGRFLNCCGDIYTGDFCYGKRHGVGKIIYYDNDPYDSDWYEGDWEDDAECGKGKKKFMNGDLYEGEYYNFNKVELKYTANRHGVFHNYWYEGKKTYANGDVYVGKFYSHLRWGKGEMFFNHDGSIYTGTWSNDKMHGEGKFTYSDGTIDEGKWRHGVRLDDDESIKSFDSELYMVSDSYESSDNSYDFDESIEKSEKCPSCKTLTSSFIKSFPNPNVMCVCCRDEFCPIYCTMPCGHFICEECKDTYYGDNIPDIGT